MMSQSLWTMDEVIAATKGIASGGTWEAIGVSIDSRTLAPGDLFVAIEGPNHDGHDHVVAAFKAGAAAVLIHKSIPGAALGPMIRVDDTTLALTHLANAARARSKAHIVAVTGSVGKTGTKEMLRLVLSAQGLTHATQGNLNNHWGVPLSLARMPRDTLFGVFELGMNHQGELTPLTRMVRPHVAIITAIELAHAAHFTNAAAIAAAKAEIFLGLEARGVAILPRDNPYYGQLRQAAVDAGVADIQSFGTHIDADARLLDAFVQTTETTVMALVGERSLAYHIGAVGRHWAMNSLAVMLAVEALGANMGQAAAQLAEMSAPKGRGLRQHVTVNGGRVEIIDESYNASPASMRAAIAALAAVRPGGDGRRIAVLGDMLELGEDSPRLHAGIADDLEKWGIDLVFTAGPMMAHLHDALPPKRQGAHAADSTAVAAPLIAALRAGDVVMIKGSAGSKMGRVIDALSGKGA
jgi:UDP-N-acetylmuramoyl-tripeptide--D-alanyl-D-alanine ligase